MVQQGWSYQTLMEMQLTELHFWYMEAIKLYNKQNQSDG